MTRPMLRLAAPIAGADASLLATPIRLPLYGVAGALGAPENLDTHLARLGPRPVTSGAAGEDLITTLDRIGLTGRGGAHFPAATKWRAVRGLVDDARATGAPVLATVIANAAESEPASAKDAVLVGLRPHLVLDGMFGAAEAVGAQELIIWLHGGDRPGWRILEQALAERRAAGLVEPSVRLVFGPASYLSGENSAMVRGLSGGPVLPELRRVPVAFAGVQGRPTLIHNVETLARVALAARLGASGVRHSSLLTVVAAERRTVLEADRDDTVSDAVASANAVASAVADAVRAGGQPGPGDAPAQAVLFGGYGGTWLPWEQVAHLSLDVATLRAAGASLGAGVLVPLPAAACGLTETAAVLRYLAAASARQCGPCLFGLPAIAGVFTALAEGSAGRADLRHLKRFLGEVDGRGACSHPDSAVRLAASALRTFEADVRAHRRGRPCAGAVRPPILPVPAGG